VRINYDGDNYYVVGLYLSDSQPKYICYGIPGEFKRKPEGRLKEISRWFPIDFDDKEGSGYWLIFQNPGDGTITKG
jgi:hypothetical protein